MLLEFEMVCKDVQEYKEGLYFHQSQGQTHSFNSVLREVLWPENQTMHSQPNSGSWVEKWIQGFKRWAQIECFCRAIKMNG